MKLVHVFSALLLWVAAVLGGRAASAQDPPVPFLHALQDHGYGDMAIEYMKLLEKQRAVPSELRESWDLEMSKSYRAAAADFYDTQDYERLMAESQRHLEKFIEEKPDHPEAVAALAGWAEFLTRRALELIRQAKNVGKKDKGQYDNYLADARANLADARAKIEQAQKRFTARLAELPPPAASSAKKTGPRDATAVAREQLQANLQETQFQLALLDYYVAQTYPDPKSADHVAALKRAAKSFDDIFQRERLRGTTTALYAHMWHGKTREELGDFQTALEIYDEVLVNDRSGLEPLFAQVGYFRLQILARQDPKKFLTEATAWLAENSGMKRTDGYQGVSLNVAETLLTRARAAGTTTAERTKLTNEAARILGEMVKIGSQHQQEAIRLLYNLKLAGGQGKTGAGKADAGTFDEAVAMGDACKSTAEWSKALELYTLAMRLAAQTPLTDQSRADEVRESINYVQYRLALELLQNGKWNECMEMVAKMVRDEQGNAKKASPAAAQASVLSVAAALELYKSAPADKKPAMLERLEKAADFTEENWPDRPEADDSRMVRGQAKLLGGQVAEAIAIFERVNPKSDRYPLAAYLAGYNYWRGYLAEKEKPDSTRNNQQMTADRDKAIQRLAAAIEVLRRQVESGRALPRYYLETQVLLGEIRLEGGETQEAAAIFQPLVDIIQEEKPQTLDAATQHVFLGAVRAYCTLNDLDKAGKVSDVLMNLAPDTRYVNDVLIDFAQRLNLERKKASAEVTRLESAANDRQLDAAKVRLASVQDLLAKALLKLSNRRELSLPGKIFLGEALSTVGLTAEASDQFQEIIDRAKTDEKFAKAAEKAMPLVRSQLLRVLRERGEFDEALRQAEQLIKDHPNALEPLVQKGEILEAWAEKDPARFDQAVGHWVMVRNRLQPLAGKPGCPPVYYDVVYNVANCLVREAEKSKDKAVVLNQANNAEKVLKAALILNPSLNGPDTVEKYKALLTKAIKLQGRSPE